MKYLTDKEILNWNRRLENTDYVVYASPSNRSAEPDISYRQKIRAANSDTFLVTTEPFMRFDFTFSIAANREEFFFDLFSKLRQETFGTKSIFNSSEIYGNKSTQDDVKITPIAVSEDIVEDKKSNKHKVLEKEYIRYTYRFAGKLGSIMAYVSYLEDAIKYFSMIWGYTSDGEEVCLLKFPIGSIVSPIKQKSKDFLVLDYKFKRIDNNYYIDYISSEMLSTSSVITYGKIEVFKEEELSFSRNNRIDNILN